MKHIYMIHVIAIVFISLFSCDGGQMSDSKTSIPSIEDIPSSSWNKLSEKKIFFGHQSVGNNIIKGVEEVMNENQQVRLKVVETANQADFESGVLAHSRVGQNSKPKSKIDAFVDYMHGGLGSQVDIAFFKFCYIDIDPETDVEVLFNQYKSAMNNLNDTYPNTVFVHVTIPIKVVQTGPRSWIKNIIGRPIGGYEDNVKRNQFNELVRGEYQGKEPIFDLASIESTYPNGSRESFKTGGKRYFALIPEYSHDGRHLNEIGRKKAAEQLLILLSSLC